MTDILTSQLLPASFRGVSFKIRGEVLPEEGRKIVLHEYVNSSARFVEDLGGIPSRFQVNAFVHGVDFRERSDALRAALNTKGVGRLVLPVFGAVDAYAMPYSIDTSQTSVGEISFSLNFAVGRPSPGPLAADADLQTVYGLGDNARAAVEGAVADEWVPPVNTENVISATGDFNSAIDEALDAVKAQIPSDVLTDINKIVSAVEDGVSTIIRDGSELASTLIGSSVSAPGFWQSISLGLGQSIDISSAFKSLTPLLNYGNGLSLNLNGVQGDFISTGLESLGFPLWPPTTAERIARNVNRNVLVFGTRVNALIAGFESASAAEYRTVNDVQAVRNILDDAYSSIMVNTPPGDGRVQFDSTARPAINAVRIASNSVLEQKRQEAFKVNTTFSQVKLPSFVGAYNYYAEEFTNAEELQTRAIELRNINNTSPVNALSGNIEVFRE